MPKPKLAPVSRASRLDDLVEARLEDVGRLQEDPLPLGGHALRPRGERCGCARHRALCVGAGAGCDLGDDVAGEGIAVLERSPAVGGLSTRRR